MNQNKKLSNTNVTAAESQAFPLTGSFTSTLICSNPQSNTVMCRRTRFKVIVDNGRSDLIEVLQGIDNLHNDGAALFLRHELVLLQVEVQVVALAVLQDGAEPAAQQGRSWLLVSKLRFYILKNALCMNICLGGHPFERKWLTSQCRAKSSRRV